MLSATAGGISSVTFELVATEEGSALGIDTGTAEPTAAASSVRSLSASPPFADDLRDDLDTDLRGGMVDDVVIVGNVIDIPHTIVLIQCSWVAVI